MQKNANVHNVVLLLLDNQCTVSCVYKQVLLHVLHLFGDNPRSSSSSGLSSEPRFPLRLLGWSVSPAATSWLPAVSPLQAAPIWSQCCQWVQQHMRRDRGFKISVALSHAQLMGVV